MPAGISPLRRPAESKHRPRFSADQHDLCGLQVVRRRGVQQEVGSEHWFGTKTQRSLDAMARFSASPIQTSNQITIPLPSSSFSPWFRLQIGVDFPTHTDGTVSMLPLPPRVRVPLVRPSHTVASATFLLHRHAVPSLPGPSGLDPHHSNHTSKRIRRYFSPRERAFQVSWGIRIEPWTSGWKKKSIRIGAWFRSTDLWVAHTRVSVYGPTTLPLRHSDAL